MNQAACLFPIKVLLRLQGDNVDKKEDINSARVSRGKVALNRDFERESTVVALKDRASGGVSSNEDLDMCERRRGRACN